MTNDYRQTIDKRQKTKKTKRQKDKKTHKGPRFRKLRRQR